MLSLLIAPTQRSSTRGGRPLMVFSEYHESWRKHPMLTNTYRHMFPGLKQAVAIFSCYLVLEWSYNRIAGPTDHHSSGPEFEGTRYGGAFEAETPKRSSH